jgi:hypothetical protein
MKQLPAITLIALSIAASAAAQSAIRPPQLGFAGVGDGTLRPVYGVAGNFIMGASIAGQGGGGKVISHAFSGSLGLLKTDSTLAGFGGHGQVLATMDAAAGPALFAFSPDGLTGLAYVPGSNKLVEWKAGQLVTMPFHSELGTVLAVALSNAFEPSLIVQRNDGIWEVTSASQKALVGATAPVLALASGDLVYSDATGIVVRKPDASEVHVAAQLPAKFSLQQMNSDWVQLSDLATARRFAIRVLAGREGFYQLPEAGQ